jgi:DNA-binding CsgD family transcriptional regulator
MDSGIGIFDGEPNGGAPALRGLGERPAPAARPAGLREAIIDQLALGIVVVALDGRVLHANRAGLKALLGAGLFIGHEGKLASHCTGDVVALYRAVSATAAEARTVVVIDSGRLRVTIAAQPLRYTHEGRRRAAAMLLMNVDAHPDASAIVAYGDAHLLTRAERSVLLALSGGLRAKEVAATTRSSVATVRSHLRSIYQKTGVRNLQDLLARVAALPPLDTH